MFSEYLRRLDSDLRRLRGRTINGVVFGLHGSTTVRGHVDAQRDIIQLIRSHLGTDVPVVVTFDLHASPSLDLQRAVDGIVAYHTAPHRDIVQTGRRAAHLVLRLLSLPTKPTLISLRIPILLPGEFGQTSQEPMRQIMAHVRDLWHDSPQVLEASLLQGYPWADNAHAMMSLVVVATEASTDLVDRIETLGRSIFTLRSGLHRSTPVVAMTEALATVTRRHDSQLLYLCDSGDNPTAGAVEDRVDFLTEAVREGTQGLVFCPIVAPLTVARSKAQVGSTITLNLGAQLADIGPQLSLDAKIVARFDDDDLGGDTIVLEFAGNRILVTSKRVAMHSPRWLSRFGIDPVDRSQVLVLKSGYLFPEYQDLLVAQGTEAPMLVATPGASSLDLTTFAYHQVPRPIYPLDDSGPWSLVLTVTCRQHIAQMTPILL